MWSRDISSSSHHGSRNGGWFESVPVSTDRSGRRVDDDLDDEEEEEEEEDEDDDEDEEEWRMTFCLATTIQTMSDKYDVLHYIFNSDDDFGLNYDRLEDVRIVNRLMVTRYRKFKNTLHMHYKKFPTKEEALKNPHEQVEPKMWTKLCNIFADPRYEGKSEINRRNRSKLTVYHTTGTKSFARKRHELLGAVHIDEVGPADLYAASHKRKNGEWICDAARMNFEKMMEVAAQATMEGRTLTDVEVFTQVLGEKRGYVRGLGDSVRPVSTSCSSSSADMARRLMETQLELEQIRADREKESQEQMHEIHSLQQKMEEMHERMARYDRFMSRFASGAFDDVGV
ncbi:hypothetical protein CJ030_MR1G018144 [Morella rubra]|uniref:Transposase, Ptta/En/Spm, plant n=1 Tax=Morella rubra TaxID=262757 RepID=A0A6A1WMX2_9ROSI|nr:hypothetical protein CJ030_MR1G018144 [Morella rubra]